jgi:hypothetical protein
VGSTQAVERLLAAADRPLLRLQSPGGRIAESVSLARLIRRHSLDTYVESECDSACTVAFLSGRERIATLDARLGFHRSSIVGIDVERVDDAELKAAYVEASDARDRRRGE